MTIHNKARMIAYQENGLKIESFAEVTNRHNSFAGAVDAFIGYFNFVVEGLESTKLLSVGIQQLRCVTPRTLTYLFHQ